MVAASWYTFNYFHISFGKQDHSVYNSTFKWSEFWEVHIIGISVIPLKVKYKEPEDVQMSFCIFHHFT